MFPGAQFRARQDVQKQLLGMIFAETILIGHSLHNDLRVLRLIHSRVIDTAILFPHPKVGAASPSGSP